jgi:hypothetical protein
MLGLHYRSAYAIALLGGVALGAGLLPTSAAAAAEGEVQSSMQCDRASEPGRVRCTVEARTSGGRTIAWADVEILSLPDFASALKGRIGPQDATSRDATATKWALGLVARRSGQGEVRARVRLVACEAPRAGAPSGEPSTRCTPVIVEVKAQVTVG